MGTDTREDRENINKRVMKKRSGPAKPTNPNTSYACTTNKERNAVEASSFKNHILATHPKIENAEQPPDNMLIIEASLRRKKKKVSQAIQDVVVSKLGDDDIRATDFSSKGAKITPAMRCYPGSHHMCITNKDLDKGRGNGTLCRCLGVKLKQGARREWKNWEGRKVYTVSVDDVEWVEFEHWPEPPKNSTRTFRLTPQTFSATIKLPLTNDCDGLTIKVGNVRVSQIPVNSNIATTGHKLQGMSKDSLIVNSWAYGFSNWVYVVLSRVRTLSGLFLNKPLDLDKDFEVPQNLVQFENRMQAREAHFLQTRQLQMNTLH